ncbi:hypothetical protein BJV78DRAFT_1279345 [Lactifluus subvellereus]|nr:hypothetical protein BJV78DRAFT_1279345 [Lactifluus subvellereus]
MVTSDRAQQATTNLPPSSNLVQAVEARCLPRADRGAPSIRTAYQNLPSPHPRIPRLVFRHGKGPRSPLDSQFQVNASQVQKPLSLIVPDEKNSLVSPARCSSASQDENGRPSEMESSSSSEQDGLGKSVPNLKHEKPCKRGRRTSPPTDSDDEDPFHFDTILSSSPVKKNVSPSSTLSSTFFRRASIIPVDPNAAPAPHRFSLLRERASEETIFVQEICDADGRRWSLRVPASGLPEDMVHMLEELEKLALELGQTLPRIVVTCSAESLSLKRMELDANIKSSELLRPPPTVSGPSEEGDATSERSLAKEKCRLVEPEQGCEEPARPALTSSVAVSSPSEQSLTCIYLPEFAPEFLSGSSTSPVLQPADGFHSKPASTVQCPRQRAFFSALKEPAKSSAPASGIAKRLVPRTSTAEAAPSAKPKYRIQAKSALPILKASNSKPIAAPGTAATDRTRTLFSSGPKSPDPLPPPLPVGPRAHAHAVPRPAAALAGSQANRSGAADALRSVSAPASTTTTPPQSARKLRHLFRRPPVRSASDPPVYSARPATVKRPASEVVPARQEVVVERRMPRLPSARDLLRKLT